MIQRDVSNGGDLFPACGLEGFEGGRSVMRTTAHSTGHCRARKAGTWAASVVMRSKRIGLLTLGCDAQKSKAFGRASYDCSTLM